MTLEEFEELDESFDIWAENPFRNQNIDTKVLLINKLRDKIPYEVCGAIMGGAEHDKLWLCDANEEVIELFTEEEMLELLQLGLCYDEEYESFFIFV